MLQWYCSEIFSRITDLGVASKDTENWQQDADAMDEKMGRFYCDNDHTVLPMDLMERR